MKVPPPGLSMKYVLSGVSILIGFIDKAVYFSWENTDHYMKFLQSNTFIKELNLAEQ
jgi:hypothetical protein